MDDREDAMASSTALRAAKKELRSFMKLKLLSLSAESIKAQSAAVFSKIICPAFPVSNYDEARRIGIYLSMPTGELQTDAIVRHALSAGKQVFVPYIFKPSNPPPNTPKSVMDMVALRDIGDYESLQRDSWGIPTIGADTVADREHVLGSGSQGLHMILMPGVAFDIDPESGFIRRLGHGKGFYDYFLQRYKEIHGTKVVEEDYRSPQIYCSLHGLALKEQFLESDIGSSVPIGERDYLLHGLVVGDGKAVERSMGITKVI